MKAMRANHNRAARPAGHTAYSATNDDWARIRGGPPAAPSPQRIIRLHKKIHPQRGEPLATARLGPPVNERVHGRSSTLDPNWSQRTSKITTSAWTHTSVFRSIWEGCYSGTNQELRLWPVITSISRGNRCFWHLPSSCHHIS